MERFIRDKYERHAFKKASPSMTPRAQSSESQRFSPQLAQLSELGFKDTSQNIKILKATHGNLQEALDILTVGKSEGNSPVFDPLSANHAAKTSISDLVDISFDSSPKTSEAKSKDIPFTQSPAEKFRTDVDKSRDVFDSPW